MCDLDHSFANRENITETGNISLNGLSSVLQITVNKEDMHETLCYNFFFLKIYYFEQVMKRLTKKRVIIIFLSLPILPFQTSVFHINSVHVYKMTKYKQIFTLFHGQTLTNSSGQ